MYDVNVYSLAAEKQQQLTSKIMSATLEALEAIPVDYDSVPLPGGETA